MRTVIFVLRQCWKSKKGTVKIILWNLLTLVYVWINTRVTLQLPKIFDNLDNLKENLTVLMIYCVINTVLEWIIRVLETGAHDIALVCSREFFEKITTADADLFISRTCANITTASSAVYSFGQFLRVVGRIISDVVMILMLMISLYQLLPDLALCCAIVYTPTGIGIVATMRCIAKMNKEKEARVYAKNQEIHEVIDGFLEVRSFDAGEHHIDSLTRKNEEVHNIVLKKVTQIANTFTLFCAGDTVAMAISILVVANKIPSGEATPAMGLAAIILLWRIADPIARICDNFAEASELLSSVHRYIDVMEYKNASVSGQHSCENFNDAIKVDGVSFTYNNASVNDILSDVSMTIEKGQKIGICGESGGGKSTLFKLLTKLYDPTKGSITIDGTSYQDINLGSLRKLMGVVHQDNHIFDGSVYDNVVYGNWSSTEYEVVEACKKANIYDFIQSLPDKFQTDVGPNGLKLSGGQKQRIALARVFLSNPEIILLDEATSSLDTESEKLIQEAMEHFKDKTVIAIAHRLSTIRKCDKIYVVGNHGILESGTHSELIEARGVYAKLNGIK